MKLTQEELPFPAITIVLETKREANIMLNAMQRFYDASACGPIEIAFAKELKDWLRKRVGETP